jgi:phosphomevalonate kinase
MTGTYVQATAPGKLVICGEYAVLAGATALVQAVDRRARCEIVTGGAEWTFVAHGFGGGRTRHPRARLLAERAPSPADPAWLCHWLLKAFASAGVDDETWPPGATITLDTRAFFSDGSKLGIGSSAAVCAALGATLARLAGVDDPYPIIAAAHKRAQQGRGSGLDVAAAWHGGLLAFRSRDGAAALIEPRTMPAGVHAAYIFTGSSASTVEHITRFERWRLGRTPPALATLGAAADSVAAAAGSVTSGADFVAELAAYVSRLEALDDEAQLGIFGPAHRALRQIGARIGVTYKPSGAGGADMGLAIGCDDAALTRFVAAVQSAGYAIPPMEPDQHGIDVTTGRN